MWTINNTEGFNQADLDMINAVIDRIFAYADGIEEHSINDAINNEFHEGIDAAELESAVRKRLGMN